MSSEEMDLESLIERLVPKEGVKISGISGTEYEIPSRVGARKQVRATRKLRDLVSKMSSDGIAVSMDGDGIKAFANAIIEDDEDEYIEGLFEVFKSAFPKIVDNEKSVCEDHGVAFENEADLFALEDLVEALLPLSLRAASRMMQLANQVNKAAQK